MQNTKDRVFAVQRRVKEIEIEKRIQKRRLVGFSFLAASLLIIVGLSLLMPNITSTMSAEQYNNHIISASIFDENNYLGYIFIGILAFSLGISVTILSYQIRKRNQLDQDDLED